MLHQIKHQHSRLWKFSIVLPLLVAFMVVFSTASVAQTSPKKSEPKPEDVKIGQNVLRFVISKDTKDNQLERIKQKLAEKEIQVEFDNVKRNDTKEITGIEISYKTKNSNGNHVVNSEVPIKDIAIEYNINEHEFTVGEARKAMSQSFKVIKDKDGDPTLEKEDGDGFTYTTSGTEKVIIVKSDATNTTTEKNVFVFSDDEQESDEIMIVETDNIGNKKDTVWVRKNNSEVVWTDAKGRDVEIVQVEKSDKQTHIFVGENENPLILLDGKEITKEEMGALDPGTIANMNVYKGEMAVENYGEKAKDGAIVITSKKE